MGKIAFLFPGQGAQVVGMGQDFYETYEVSKNIFELASEASGLDVAKLCFSENDELNITEYTQTALLATEIAILKVVLDKGIKPDYAAGLSLGEYGAVSTAGAISDRDLFALIRKRGIYMQDAYPVGGAMTAVIGMEPEIVEKACEEASKEAEGVVKVANYNCPGQLVISGADFAVKKAMERLAEAGAKRCIPLNVSGPFHTELLKVASEKLTDEMNNLEFSNPTIPYYSNVEATLVEVADGIKEMLAKQMISSVCFWQSIEKMIADGVDTFVEIGPGKSLSGFVKRINKEVKIINIDKVEDLAKLEEITC